MTSWGATRAHSLRDALSWYDQQTVFDHERLADPASWDVVTAVAVDALRPLASLLAVDAADLFRELTEGASVVEGVESVAELIETPWLRLLRRLRSGKTGEAVSASGETTVVPFLAAQAAELASAEGGDLAVQDLPKPTPWRIVTDRYAERRLGHDGSELADREDRPRRLSPESPMAAGHPVNAPNPLSRARAWRALGADEVVSVAA